MRSQTSRGFGHVLLVLVLVVIAVIGGIAYVVYGRQSNHDSDTAASQSVKTGDVPAAPEINNSADLDTANKTLDQFDPSSASQSDSSAIDSQVNGL